MTLAQRFGAAMKAFRGQPARRYGIWDAAQANRLFSDWVATALPADEELRWSIRRMRDRARELARNNPIARRYLGLLADNVVGPCGMTLQAQVTNNDKQVNALLNDRIESAWAEWSERPTVDGRLSRVRLEQQLIKTVARDGEAFVRLWRGYGGNRFAFALEPIDADLLDEEFNRAGSNTQNEIRMGIELSDMGRPVAYHFWSEPVSSLMMSGSRRRIRVPADQVIHLYDPERVHQSRGAPWMASVMADLHMLDKYEEAALIAARLGAAQSMWFVTQESSQLASAPAANEANKIPIDVEPGQLGFAPPGYEPRVVSPTYPHTDYGSFVKECKRRIASGLEVSYNGLCNDLSDINYSSYKGGLQGERDRYRSLQHWWIGAFLQPVYREWIDMALLVGALRLDSRDPMKFREVRWSPRGWPSIEPLKEVQAAIEGIKHGLTSRTRILAEQGEDLEKVFADLEAEQRLAGQIGIEIAGDEKAEKAEKAEPEETPEPEQNGYTRIAQVLSAGRRTP